MAPRRSTRLGNKKTCVPSSPLKNPSVSTSLSKNKGGSKKTNKTVKRARKSAPRKSLQQLTNLPVVIDIVETPTINCVPPPRNSRPQVINLDVTYSESSSESDVEEISTPHPKRSNNTSVETESVPEKSDLNSHKNIKNGRYSLSDSDEDFVPDFNPIGRDETDTTPKRKNKSITYDSDSDSDIYKVNYKEEREKALEEVAKEFQKKNEIQKKKEMEKVSFALLDNSNLSENLDIWDSDKSNLDSLLEDSINISNLSSISVNNGKRGRRSIVRTSKKTKMALQSLEAFSKKFDDMEKEKEEDDSFCDDIIMMEDSDVSIRIFWGLTTYTRHTLKKNAKLIGLYQELAEKNNASVNEVVLSFKDKILSPETRPSDLKLSIADILDGAIIRKSSKTNDCESTKEEEGSLSFKIQTSNRKEVHTISISKYDKMSSLMEKYAKLRNISLDKLRFKFDGESLEPSDTPSSLDLEGGECIDVFEL